MNAPVIDRNAEIIAGKAALSTGISVTTIPTARDPEAALPVAAAGAVVGATTGATITGAVAATLNARITVTMSDATQATLTQERDAAVVVVAAKVTGTMMGVRGLRKRVTTRGAGPRKEVAERVVRTCAAATS
jgi:outer membrane lipoprotein SlyB